MAAGYDSLLAPWIGGASAAPAGAGYDSLLGFWFGGASAGRRPAGEAATGGWPLPQRGVRKVRRLEARLPAPDVAALRDEAAQRARARLDALQAQREAIADAEQHELLLFAQIYLSLLVARWQAIRQARRDEDDALLLILAAAS